MKKSLRKFIQRIGKKRFAVLFSFVFCLPIIIWNFCHSGWTALPASIAGFIIGQFICLKFIKY